MTAKDLLHALETKHAQDVCVPEAKDGPTTAAGPKESHRRVDLWVLRRTWSPITCIAYEIKVSRSDWLRDQKIRDYRPLCHLLYIVAPKGVVQQSELPEGVGLLEPVGEQLDIRT